MGMSRCYSLMKVLLILFNIIFLIVGGCGCGFACWVLWDGRASEEASAKAGLCALAAWGCVLALAAVAALAGAIRSSASVLAGAFALHALAAVAEGAAAWWGGAHLPHLRVALRERLLYGMQHEYGAITSLTHVVDAIQEGLECCGTESARDWQNAAWARAQMHSELTVGELAAGGASLDLSVTAPARYYAVPESCCTKESLSGGTCESMRRVAAASGGGAGVHGAGCGGRVLDALAAAARGPLLVAGALLLTHAITLLLALALCLHDRPLPRHKA